MYALTYVLIPAVKLERIKIKIGDEAEGVSERKKVMQTSQIITLSSTAFAFA